MASKPVPAPLAGFVRLNSSIYLYNPISNTVATSKPSSTSTSDPDLILLPAWLEAAPKHIAKYTTGYQRLYPNARILLITTSLADGTYASRSSQTRRIAPALSLLLSLPSDTKILLSLFSNGGSYTICLLARAYHAQTSRPLPIAALILDSTPGSVEHRRTFTALSLGFPRSPAMLYYLFAAALHVFLVCYRLWKMVTWSDDLITELRRDLNDERLFAKDVPRAYIYSKADAMVGWEYVEEHGAEARARSYVVRMAMWESSGHCGHLMVDPQRYWGVVKGLWEERKR